MPADFRRAKGSGIHKPGAELFWEATLAVQCVQQGLPGRWGDAISGQGGPFLGIRFCGLREPTGLPFTQTQGHPKAAFCGCVRSELRRKVIQKQMFCFFAADIHGKQLLVFALNAFSKVTTKYFCFPLWHMAASFLRILHGAVRGTGADC